MKFESINFGDKNVKPSCRNISNRIIWDLQEEFLVTFMSLLSINILDKLSVKNEILIARRL